MLLPNRFCRLFGGKIASVPLRRNPIQAVLQ
jgi:hypothetical protein